MGDELKGHWFGPMPVHDFLEVFLPFAPGQQHRELPNRFSKLPSHIQLKEELDKPLLDPINRSPKLMPNYEVFDSSDHPDKGAHSGERHKPDFSTYHMEINSNEDKRQMDHQELPWEIKPNHSWNIGEHPPKPVDASGAGSHSGGQGRGGRERVGKGSEDEGEEDGMEVEESDLAKDINDTNPRNHQRTGTWQFISTLLCWDTNKLHTRQDDLESLTLVLLYHTIRYTHHTYALESTHLVSRIFSESHHANGETYGGQTKRDMFYFGIEDVMGKSGVPEREFYIFGNEPLNLWIDRGLKAVGEWIRFHGPEWRRSGFDGSQKGALLDEDKDNAVENSPLPDIGKAFLKDHEKFLSLCEAALARDNWPSDDPAHDNCMWNMTSIPSPRPRSVTSRTSSKDKRSHEPTRLGTVEHQKKRLKSGGSRGSRGSKGN